MERVSLTEIDMRVDERLIGCLQMDWFRGLNDERRGNKYTVHLFLDGEYHVMDEVAHVCNDYWPTARQLWKPAVVVVELGVSHLLWCLKK